MGEGRIDQAMARIDAALVRIDAARQTIADAPPASSGHNSDNTGSARVMALVNSHEKLREEVADTLAELDTLIEEMEG
jgi:hypothetical protein